MQIISFFPRLEFNLNFALIGHLHFNELLRMHHSNPLRFSLMKTLKIFNILHINDRRFLEMYFNNI